MRDMFLEILGTARAALELGSGTVKWLHPGSVVLYLGVVGRFEAILHESGRVLVMSARPGRGA